MTEIWKDIPGYEGHYQVSNTGRVKSLKRKKEKILYIHKALHKYPIVKLSKNGQFKTIQPDKLAKRLFT